jgi:hypothetical protein
MASKHSVSRTSGFYNITELSCLKHILAHSDERGSNAFKHGRLNDICVGVAVTRAIVDQQSLDCRSGGRTSRWYCSHRSGNFLVEEEVKEDQ